MTIVLPSFRDIVIADIEKNLDQLLQKNTQAIEALLLQSAYTWDNLIAPLETIDDTLAQFWSPIRHMDAVVNSEALRKSIEACLPKLSDYHTHWAHHEKLFHAVESIKNSTAFSALSVAQKKSIDNQLCDFKLSGVHLPLPQKKQFAEFSKQLSQLSHRFEENVLDATMAFQHIITDEKLLSGIPEHAKSAAKLLAEQNKKEGWMFTLEAPSYLAIMTFSDSSALREIFYRAYVTRAPANAAVMRDMLRLRFALAKLLGFENFAQYSLATKMVKTTDEVMQFLNDLADKAIAKARDEFAALCRFSKETLALEKLNAWDVTYAAEKFREQRFHLSQEELRPYFPQNKVMSGLFHIISKLYGVTFEKVSDADVWHRDVSCYRMLDSNHVVQAHWYFDLYARPNKRAGAWMDDPIIRRRLDRNNIQLPVVFVTCNFNAPIGNEPALFTHDDVVTLFHESGHALQQVLTHVDVADVSGIQGVPWDAVEVASQFFENWAWENESIHHIAAHYQTNAAPPDALLQRMQDAKYFQSAMHMMRQLEFALFDFELHMHYDDHNPDSVQMILDNVRKKVSVVPVPDFNRFQNSFSHIFGGGYAAGYYSYKLAEVMACDAFSLFHEKGIFDSATAALFKKTFLESGGAVEPMDLFIAFRGRKPTVDALLKHSNIPTNTTNPTH